MSGSQRRIVGNLILVLLVSTVSAATEAPVLVNAVIGASGGSAGEPNYSVRCTVGQPFTGATSGTGTTLAIGFWPSFQDYASPVPEVSHYDWRLNNNHPNPFNPRTAIRYSLPAEAAVRLEIYDLRGHLVRNLVDTVRPAGDHVAIWNGVGDDGGPVASGLYIVRLSSPDGVLTHKMMLTR